MGPREPSSWTCRPKSDVEKMAGELDSSDQHVGSETCLGDAHLCAQCVSAFPFSRNQSSTDSVNDRHLPLVPEGRDFVSASAFWLFGKLQSATHNLQSPVNLA